MTKNYNYNGYAFQYPDGSLAAIDRASGGYLWKAPSIAWAWITTKEELEKYPLGSTGEEKGVKIVHVTVSVTVNGS